MLKNFTIVVFFILVTTSSNAVGQGSCGSCGGPIDVNSRKLWESLGLDSDEALSQKLSDPRLCETINCFGLTQEEAQNTIKNAIEFHRFEKSQQLAENTRNQSFYFSILSVIISTLSLAVAGVALMVNWRKSK